MTDSRLPPAPAVRQVLDGYLADLATRLPGPGRARRAVLAELGDGLLDATQAHLDGGLAPAAAARAATAEFGEAATLAHAFAPELLGAQARRRALLLIHTGPLVGGLWLGALAAGQPPPWRRQLAGAWLGLPVAAVALLSAMLALLLVVAATGRASRWLPARPTLAPGAAAAAGLAAVVVDLAMLGTLTGQALTAPTRLAWPLAAAAAAASLTRLVLASRATRRSLAARAALG
jgi:hypothetical protein